MANTTIKITQLQNIGNGLAGNTLLPVVNTTGTAITQKVTVGNVANFVLGQAGNTLAPAFLANLAYSVVNAAQPNITSVGTLNVNTLKISGGTNGYILQTDGAGNLSWAAGGGGGNGDVGGTNTQVQFNDAGDFGGNTGFTFDKTTGVLSASKINSANIFSLSGATINNSDLSHGATSGLTIPTNGSNSVPATIYNNYGQVVVTTGINPGNLVSWTFGNAGALQSPGGSFLTDDVEGTGDFGVSTEYNVGFVIKTSDNTQTWTFDTLGNLTLPGNTFAINYANGTPVPITSVPSRMANGTSNVNIPVINGNVSITSNANTWTFSTTGNLTLPGNTFAVNYANGAAVTIPTVGNIATINLTGSTSNVLYGNGTFAAVPAPTVAQDITSNGAMSIMLFDGNIKYNNYATVEPSSGNIAGGNISANGNISGGNISATGNITANNLGNISSINIDGSNTNVLYGNGVFAAVAGGNANTGNVTFDDNIVIGTGDEFGGDGLFLAPGNGSIANSAVQYLRCAAGIIQLTYILTQATINIMTNTLVPTVGI
jgi:hypothetical protein